MKVYKYRGGEPATFQRDLDMLARNQFWASQADKLNDPAEGFVDDQRVRSTLAAAGADDVLGRFNQLMQMRKQVGVYSLSRTPSDALLWAYYSSGHSGFCIEYDLDRLCLEARTTWDVVDVAYHATPQSVTFDDVGSSFDTKRILVKMIGTKSLRWAHEEETRIVTTVPGLNNYAEEALTGIYFGCRCSDAFVASVRSKLAGRRVGFHRTEFAGASYNLQITTLAPDTSSPAPATWLAPVDEHAIPEADLLDEKWRGYAGSLAVAVERVRRDRSCNRVLLVDFSTKTKEGKPLVFVQYETSVVTQLANTVNRYFELGELTEAVRGA